MDSLTNIEKEKVATLSFPDSEVLPTPEAVQQRQLDLEKGMLLGNNEHGKIKIVFEDLTGLKQIETTIWATTDKRIVLKGGVGIPINRIHKVII